MSSENTALSAGSFFSSVMWPLTSHMPLRIYLISPFAEWGSSLIYCLGLSAYNTYKPFNLGVVSHGACALGISKGKIQYVGQRMGPKRSLMGSGTSEKAFPFLPILAPSPPPLPNGGLKGRLEGHLLLFKRGPNFLVLFFSIEILDQVPHLGFCVCLSL